MRSTMMDAPLTVTALMRYGTSAYGDRQVVTCTADGSRRQSYAETGARAARLANALRSLGVDADQRIGTLMWNNSEHLEAYLAVPSMGAVLHTLNLRLDPEVIGYIATHAGDDVIIVDATLVPLLCRVLPHAPAVRHVLVTGKPGKHGETDGSALAGLAGQGREVHYYEDLLAAQPIRSAGPRSTSGWPPPCATRAARPGTRRALSTATAPRTCIRLASARAMSSRCPSRTGCCRWCRCSTPTPGGSPTRRCWPGRT